MFAIIRPNVPFSSEAFSIFIQSLGITIKSMTGIFIVIFLFYIIILLLEKISAEK